jgi:hypothetical protein
MIDVNWFDLYVSKVDLVACPEWSKVQPRYVELQVRSAHLA